MDEARDNACNDMGKMLQFVLPVATQIQQEVIKAYGFSCDGEDSYLARRGAASDAQAVPCCCLGHPNPLGVWVDLHSPLQVSLSLPAWSSLTKPRIPRLPACRAS
ncbi:gene rich cluster C10 protein [Rhinolophus ferrumequinum]|uniref:Protein C10 n=1 Tax=Rhinolophus ferrumequinum TaxID=59479 RepID=A0A7J7WNH8_RHIFE|nr:gene rich cluster C10 protein [Rhinolophus ferrumequinum]